MRAYNLFLCFITLFLGGCSFSLAEDITPPPDYVSPTPLPDYGGLYPTEQPSPSRGSEIYISDCESCHGKDGLGNGPLASSMPVAVPAIALPDISSHYSPSDWFKVMSLGNIERGMPSFSNYSSRDRWDVLSYIYLLSVAPEDLVRADYLYDNYCSECHDPAINTTGIDFFDHVVMSQKTNMGIYRSIVEEHEDGEMYLENFSENEIWALTFYIRTLGYDMSITDATPTYSTEPSLTGTPTPMPTATIDAAVTNVLLIMPTGTESGELRVTQPVTIEIAGTITNGSGTELQRDLVATVIFFDRENNEIFNTITADVNPDGTYIFSNLSADAQTTYWVSVDYQDVSYYSEFVIFDGSTYTYNMPVVVYDASSDWLSLKFDFIHIALEISENAIQVNELFVMSNPGLSTIVLETDGTSLPFLRLPGGVSELSSLSPDSRGAAFLPATNGIALPPLIDSQYGILASFSIPYEHKYDFEQSFPMPVDSVSLFTPENLRIKTNQLEDSGTEEFDRTIYHIYEATNLPAGLLSFTITGKLSANSTAEQYQRSWVIIVIGLLGIVFIGLGIFLFLRERSAEKEEFFEEVAPETSEEIHLKDPATDLMDAIIALDEKRINEDISDEVHKKRRAALKARLKDIL